MNDLVQGLVAFLRKELEKPEWRQEILRPLIKWIILGTLPYVLALLCLNFFCTIAAISLVLYLHRK